MRSLKMRLLIGTSLTSVAVLSMLGLSVYALMRHTLLRNFDASLRADAGRVANMVRQEDNGRLDFDFDSEQMPDFLTDQRGRFFQIWRDDGRTLGRSPSLRDRDLPKTAPAHEAVGEVMLPGDRRGRAVTMSFAAQREDQRDRRSRTPTRTIAVTVAADLADVRNTLQSLGWLLTTLCIAGVIVSGAVLLSIVGHGLRPVKRLAGEIESLRETDLSHRLPAEGVPQELTPVVEKLNGLLARLEGAFTREKAFTADVAHELRTPLTGLRMTLEVCRSQPRQALAYETAMDECRAITDRMEAMVESLLMLARSDAGQMTVERKSVDVSKLVAECWSLVHYRAEQNGVVVAMDLSGSCVIETDPDKLRIVLQNILDNAVSYVDKAGRIRIVVRRDEHTASVEIANTGSQIAAEDAAKLFERFWRGDTARTDAGTHCGLGLSLSQRLMKLIGGEISVKTDRDGEFIVCLNITEPSAAAATEG